MLPATLAGTSFLLRPWRLADRDALLRHADDRAIWRNLRDHFPHPYTPAAADAWLRFAATEPPPEGIWAIEVDGEAAGCLALERQGDVAACGMEIGYWLGRTHWNRGIVTAAVALATAAALAEPGIVRIFAPVFGWNDRSMRVLERNGYVREAVLRQAVRKDGTLTDQVIYARLRTPDLPYLPADR